MENLQREVYAAVARRGYLDGRTPEDIIRRQVIKAMEELGEVARYVFDGHRPPPVAELADVVIPMLVIAEEADYDLLAAVLEKSRKDIERGVR